MHPEISLSVVSHGQGELVRHLLEDIATGVDASFELIVTLNIPEDEVFLSSVAHLRPIVLRNERPKGFGANHNAAFAHATGRFFAVLNPDIRARPFRVRPLIDLLSATSAGACGPLVRGPDGEVQDSARHFPTAARLLARRVLHRRTADYVLNGSVQQVDWLAGMFVVYPQESFSAVGGFDEGYFMYLEDTDICWRLARMGKPSMLQPAVTVVHDARRASRKSLRHFAWHMSSALRFLLKSALGFSIQPQSNGKKSP